MKLCLLSLLVSAAVFLSTVQSAPLEAEMRRLQSLADKLLVYASLVHKECGFSKDDQRTFQRNIHRFDACINKKQMATIENMQDCLNEVTKSNGVAYKKKVRCASGHLKNKHIVRA